MVSVPGVPRARCHICCCCGCCFSTFWFIKFPLVNRPNFWPGIFSSWLRFRYSLDFGPIVLSLLCEVDHEAFPVSVAVMHLGKIKKEKGVGQEKLPNISLHPQLNPTILG